MKKKIFIFIGVIVIIALFFGASLFKNNKEISYEKNIYETYNNTKEIQINTIQEENNVETLLEKIDVVEELNSVISNSKDITKEKIEETKNKENNNTEVKDENTTNIEKPTISPDKTEEKKETDTVNVIEKVDSKDTIIKNEEVPITKEDISHPELAYSTYRVTNNEIVQEIINILTDEISKDKELVDFGCKVVSTNKDNAYSNTSGFTYLFVKDITKGKVTGNYQKFTERVKNTVGSFGTYYVYAEDEYTYDGQGLNPKWSQTLVWIYVRF